MNVASQTGQWNVEVQYNPLNLKPFTTENILQIACKKKSCIKSETNSDNKRNEKPPHRLLYRSAQEKDSAMPRPHT